jgi:hypothetical protein
LKGGGALSSSVLQAFQGYSLNRFSVFAFPPDLWFPAHRGVQSFKYKKSPAMHGCEFHVDSGAEGAHFAQFEKRTISAYLRKAWCPGRESNPD